MANTLNQGAQAIGSKLDTSNETMAETLSQGVEAISSNLDSSNETMAKTLSHGAQAISSNLQSNSQMMAETLSHGVEAISSSINSSNEIMAETLSHGAQAISENLELTRGQLAETMDEKSRSLQHSLETSRAQIDETLNTQSSALQKNLEIAHVTLASGLIENSALVADTLDQGQRAIAASIDEKTSETAATMDAKAKQISDLLAERVSAINASLGENLVETQKTLEVKTYELNSSLTAHSSELSSIIDNDLKPIIEGISAAGNMATQRLKETGYEVLEASDGLTQRIDATVARAAENLKQANATLNADSEEVLGRLSSSTGELKGLITNVNEAIDQFNQDVTTQADNISRAVAQSNAELEKSREIAADTTVNMGAVSATMVNNMAEIAARFEHQGRALQEATSLIDSAQNNLGATLESRQSTLDELATSLVQRSAEIEKNMTSFGDMVARMIDQSNQKTRDIGGSLTAEMSTAIEQSTEKFTTATQDMREMAKEVQRELEETRAQMRRGVLELPDETRENADAMRRVVTEQISALKSLSDIVAKSGKKLDITPAAATRSVNTATQTAPLRQQTAEPATRPFAQVTPTDNRQAERRNPATLAANVGELRDTISPAQAPVQPTRTAPQPVARDPKPYKAPAPASPTAAPVSKQNNEEGGWVSNLLRRASEDDKYAPGGNIAQGTPFATGNNTRSPQHVVESLNSLSMDIARVIDHDTSIELWDRYRRGERDVFTRRLYALQSPQTLTEISTRFVRDEEFRNTVTRYMQDFERLLTDISSNDPDNTIAESYLATDIGKVYLMLASATRRQG